MSLLESLRYDATLASQTAGAANEDFNAEGKFGIPRFGGDAAGLDEYSYRVNARAKRESLMDAGEVKKLVPLGLRLIEGLRGSALRMAQSLDPAVLAGEKGPETLIALFEKSLKPRKEQEARELYAAGSRDGGLLSRQSGEPMTWWNHLQRLDSSLQMSEAILAEQMLVNAGISEDQRLMVRTILGGNLKVETVADELLNQHPRIHEKERFGKGRFGGGSQHGSGKGHWRRNYRNSHKSYWAENEQDWDQTSQSLAGFTEDLEEDNPNYESYAMRRVATTTNSSQIMLHG